MSVLVWDGKTMAADSYGNDGFAAFPVTKLWEVDGNLCGAVGGVQAVSLLETWTNRDYDLEEYPQEARLNKAQLLVAADKHLVRYNGTPIAIRLPLKTMLAIGEGSQYAYGALDMGATAEQAVAIAIDRCIYCNGKPISISRSE